MIIISVGLLMDTESVGCRESFISNDVGTTEDRFEMINEEAGAYD